MGLTEEWVSCHGFQGWFCLAFGGFLFIFFSHNLVLGVTPSTGLQRAKLGLQPWKLCYHCPCEVAS